MGELELTSAFFFRLEFFLTSFLFASDRQGAECADNFAFSLTYLYLHLQSYIVVVSHVCHGCQFGFAHGERSERWKRHSLLGCLIFLHCLLRNRVKAKLYRVSIGFHYRSLSIDNTRYASLTESPSSPDLITLAAKSYREEIAQESQFNTIRHMIAQRHPRTHLEKKNAQCFNDIMRQPTDSVNCE